MTKALIVKLGALESCSLAASADFGMIGGTDRQDGDPWDCVHVAIHTATGGAFGPPYLLFVASLYARVATGALSASPSIRSLAGYSLCADHSRVWPEYRCLFPVFTSHCAPRLAGHRRVRVSGQ